ncbi:polycystin-1-like protein 2 isoform X1 [Danio rerio]|uniref:Polycystic kidney disease 1-like 2a n=2 Tax=Danio rerio TaxID=7955 RepID=A0A2R8Q5E7_DANRE|nr:polycystic kidney disease protein 1-like 2 [Danio rerio]APX56432.1 polycystic kidney disease 1 like 2a [Danio rerio]|eukprot:XP_017212723.2 polycystic kidney disease protein 1-like 2 [Danio rerio]
MCNRTLCILFLTLSFNVISIRSDDEEVLSCAQHQQAFESSCYEFVELRRGFLSAQAWCERGGGHLAFILNDETQQFLQKHLQPAQDWWIGLAPAFTNLTLDSAATEGPLSWLDGSDVSYSNWVQEPWLNSSCGFIQRDSGFQWETSRNCSQELFFICEFESGRSLACADHNATLQCGSGRVLEIDDSFYGRKTVHYCRTSRTPSQTSPQQEDCSWVDIIDAVSEHCHGLQVCQATADISSFGEPCPAIGSYLSVEYHCKEALHLLMSKLAAIFDNITITVKWLLHPFQGNLTCTLNAGDGHIIDNYSPEKMENVVHKYSHAGLYTVTVECSTSDWHVTAHKTITIQEPLREFGTIKCHSMSQSTNSTNCKALYNHPLKIEVQLDAGTNVTYKVQHGSTDLASASAIRGMVPVNISFSSEAQQQLGPGCHQLTVVALNEVTAAGQSSALELCLLEQLEGLTAEVDLGPGLEQCPVRVLNISVSLSRGAPARLQFLLSGDNQSFSETHQMMHGGPQVFLISNTILTGKINVVVKAENSFSSMKVDGGNTTVCRSETENQHDGKTTDEHEREARASHVQIIADPEVSVIGTTSIKLYVKGLKDDNAVWKCTESCRCSEDVIRSEIEISEACLPPVYAFSVYTVSTNANGFAQTGMKCITVIPGDNLRLSIACSNCDPVNVDESVTLQAQCEGCQKIVWYIESTEEFNGTLGQCNSEMLKKPLTQMKEDSSSFTIESKTLREAKQDIIVVVYGIKDGLSGSARYNISIHGSSETEKPSEAYTLTTVSPSHTAETVPVTLPILFRPPSCTISPHEGDVLSPFNISCSVDPAFCKAEPCIFCFKTASGEHIYCGSEPTVESLYLPLGNEHSNYRLTVVVTVKNTAGVTADTSVTTWVKDTSTKPTVKDLQALVSNQVFHLQQQGRLTGAALAQMFQSVSHRLNNALPEDQNGTVKNELRNQMLQSLSTAISSIPPKNPAEVQMSANVIAGLTTQGHELTDTTQLQASSLLTNLSKSLVSLTHAGDESSEQILQASTPIIDAVSNIIKVSSSTSKQNEISGHLLNTVGNVQSALLAGKKVNQEPIVLSTSVFGLYVNRISSDGLQKQTFNVQKNSSASFKLPSLGSDVLSANEPVDVRMTSFDINPFSRCEGKQISGSVGSLSLTNINGSEISVANLTEEIEIFLPRTQVAEINQTLLELGNFSTVVINVTAPNISLVIKLDPSEETPLQLLLGFQDYPNDTNNEARIQLPQEGNSEEERYTWVLNPSEMAMEVGVYYLLVRPIVGAGVNSTSALVYITTIAADCLYWDEIKANWSGEGCRVGPRTTTLVTQCLCTHLTFFGSSFFVMPNVVDVSRTAELFATFVNNPVVVCFVGAIILAYLLVVIWARRKDIQDAVKVKVTVLEDNDPLAEYRYLLSINTGQRRGASTSSQVTVTLQGSEGESEPHHLTDPEKPVFERGGLDLFLLTTPFSLGELQSIRLWHDNSGYYPAWYVNKVTVQDLENGQKWHFLCNSWLSIDLGECTLDKVFPVATEMDLKRFSNLFFAKTAKDFRDGHIWFSVISRPPSSNFTRVQRVSCCFSLLLCTMLTSIMFWGIPSDPSEQTMDLGKIEFTWQQVMIGIQSSIIMFPINLLIVSIFRNARPREQKSESSLKQQSKLDSTKQGKTGRVSPNQPLHDNQKEITPDTVMKDIKRIAQSLYKVMRRPVPRIELDPTKTDINNLLSLVEEIIHQHNRVGNEFYNDSSKNEQTLAASLGRVNLKESSFCESQECNEKHSIYSQYLYKQLHNVERELRLLEPSSFSKPDSYNRAVLQVQGMKNLLEPRVSFSGLHTRSASPSEASEKEGSRKCQKGLPWWFVFVGWFLVLATSGVSAYFTMLYGLTYGKERSISWLISMVVSFFESLFITQPVKVLGFAVFFALVLKTVDQDEYGDVSIDGTLSNTDDPDAVRIARRDSTCSFYKPPPPTDIEKMRNNMIKEQKVFALIREILIYVGFLWMLLLVAYGQRDPNAYYLTHHIRQSFSTGISETLNHKDIFIWANSSLLRNLYGQYPGFITDGNSKLVGNARIRQVRVRRDTCKIANPMQYSVRDCHAPYSWESEDMGSYSPGWNQTRNVNGSKTVLKPWYYQTQAKLRANPVWGGLALYKGGGFVVDLGPDQKNASRLLQYLFDNTWLDVYTRAVFVEFTVYNANVNLFCIVTLIFETTGVGTFQYRSEVQAVHLYQSTGGFHVFVMASEAIYYIFILYYMVVQGKLMKQQKWAYFKSKWNLLELAIIILSWSALSVFVKRTILGNRDIEFYQNNKDMFVSFNETATADAVLGYLIAFLVLLATIKLWHLLRLNPKLHMITSTLQRAWTDISGFIVVMTIMFLAYSIACNLMYGWRLNSYRTLLEAAQTIICLQLGIFNYDEVLDYNPVLGAFLIGSCIIFMTFVVLNLFISVILVAFNEEQLHPTPSEEEEIVELMLMKVCSLLGIKCKKKQTNADAPMTTASVIS